MKQVTGWLPIEDAPKDGQEVVVTDFDTPPQFASWKASNLYSEGGYWANRDGRRRETPTHFILIPPLQP